MIRVISLLPGATDIVTALGTAEMLVGVTHECEVLDAALPRVTRSAVDPHGSSAEIDRAVRAADAAGQPLFALDGARIAALAPDLLLTQALCDVCAVSEYDVRAIAEQLPNRPGVVTLSATTIEGVLADISTVAVALELAERGRALIARLETRMLAVHERLARAAAPRRRIAVLEWTDPVFVAGHWVPQMVRRAGGVEVLGAPGERSRMVAAQEVAAARPEIAVLAPCGYGVERAATEGNRLVSQAEWRWLADVGLWALDANVLTSRPGPRLIDGIETLASIMHPALFGTPPPSLAVELIPGHVALAKR